MGFSPWGSSKVSCNRALQNWASGTNLEKVRTSIDEIDLIQKYCKPRDFDDEGAKGGV